MTGTADREPTYVERRMSRQKVGDFVVLLHFLQSALKECLVHEHLALQLLRHMFLAIFDDTELFLQLGHLLFLFLTEFPLFMLLSIRPLHFLVILLQEFAEFDQAALRW